MKTVFSAWLKLWLSLPSTLLLAPIPYSYADEEPFIADESYNSGDLGRYVTQSYKTTKEIAPRFNINLPFTNCDDGSYIFIAPRGWVPDATLYIIDAEGNMVWTLDKQFGEVYNFAVQEYKGEPYLTFWAGNDAVGGHGAGSYFMVSIKTADTRSRGVQVLLTTPDSTTSPTSSTRKSPVRTA